MDDKQIEGGAGSSLAAHSKDASAPGATPASRMSADASTRTGATSVSDTVGQFADQAQDAANKMAASVSNITGQLRGQLSERGITTDQAAAFVRDKPVEALLAAGVVGVILGMFLARR